MKSEKEIRDEIRREVEAKYDRAFRRALAIMALLFMLALSVCASGAPKKQGVPKGAKVIELKTPKNQKAAHDSITGWYVHTDKGTASVFRGPKGGLYYWIGGKKHYLPKSFKSQINGR